ncbi:sugar MFS transporter [Salegentibacter mishustinae]|jgi:FHS family L-fucose permease-like MFS transporter|uniref:Glucose/galactose transporter n=1 Tax=Salegentibacter mishustinae TaxID=270918 RepID=A0A0Q9ZEC1_9FLAO|nr:sugar MFS transporter [Salegentibacter mishustinae]KRG27946.1 glucose/galactose transporter [Salegentibacter mishustinae]PNW21014.1 glucose/galactose transporter [Salegentibacter mishustinae]PZX63968.1 FHS family L-fucose permease-like MFS transporter [Salegentibacter mishustinae]GGW89265.1 MFS transporter [Salegentibacter mishustinae]
MEQKKSYRTAFIFVTILFFLWGFITVLVDSLIPRLREVFTLSYFQAGMVQFAFFGAYFLLSIPAGYILSKIGYKRGIILGLSTMAIGCLLFYPAASYRVFGIFMLGYFTLAAGITILQVAANPYVTILGPERTASSRLNLSQAFNSLGTAIAPALGALFILQDKVKTTAEIEALDAAAQKSYLVAEAAAVQTPFLGIAAFIGVIALVFFFVKLPKVGDKEASNDYRKVLKNRNLILGSIALFCYVGAEVSLGSYMVNYFLSLDLAATVRETSFMRTIAEWILSTGVSSSSDMAVVGVFVTFYWTGAMIGRFIGSYLTSIFNPAKILSIFALGAIGMILISNFSVGLAAMWTIIGVGLFNSIMFPTIFSLALDGLGDDKAQGSGVLCTMIVGGAIIPPAYGYLTDSFNFNIALILVMACYAYIFYYAFSNKRRKVVVA